MTRSPLSRRIIATTGGLAIAVSAIVLVGWTLDVRFPILPDLPRMKVNTALSLGLSGLSLVLVNNSRRAARIAGKTLAVLVALVGVLILVEYTFAVDLGGDQFFFIDRKNDPAGRMSPLTAINVVAVAVALLLLHSERSSALVSRTLQFICWMIVLTCLVPFLGGLVNPGDSVGVAEHTQIALHPSATLMALALGILAAQDEQQYWTVIRADTAGGQLLRRLWPAAIAMPLGLNAARIFGVRVGWFSDEYGVVVFIVGTIASFILIVWWSARSLHREDHLRRAAEGALRARELELSSMMNGAKDAIISARIDGSISFFNPAAERLFGYSASEVQGKPLTMLMPVRFRDRHLRGLSEFARTKKPRLQGQRISLVGLHKLGTELPIELSLGSWEIDGAQSFTAFISDIGERTQLEADVRAQATFLDSVVENIPDMIFVKDARELRFVRFNRAGEALLGLPRSEMLGKNDYNLFPKEQADQFTAKDRETLANHEVVDIPEEFLNTPSGVRTLHTKKIPILDENGEPRYLLGISADITERRKSELAALTLAANLAEAQALANMGSLEIDVVQGTIHRSDQVYAIFGVEKTPETMAPGGLAKYGHPEDADHVADELFSQSHAGRPCSIQTRIIRADGALRWLHFLTRPILDENGRLLRIMCTVQDITESRQVREDLEQSNRELEAFAYVASHDLQEPIRMVRSYVELLERRYAGRLDDTADRYIRYATEGARRMQELIADLLAYARIGSQPKPPEPVDTRSVVDAVLSMLAPAIEEAHASVTVGDLPTTTGDTGEYSQLFQNLISNAIKFRKKDGEVRIEIAAKRRRGAWEFAITDNGIGIESQYAERVFGVFQRLHNRTEYPGTGVGLSICRKIVERHGGTIWFEPNPTGGTVFRFTVPDAGGSTESTTSQRKAGILDLLTTN